MTKQAVICEGVFTPSTPDSKWTGIPFQGNDPVPLTVHFSEMPPQIQIMTIALTPSSGASMTWVARSNPDQPPPVSFGTQHYVAETPKSNYIFEPVAGEQLLDPEKAADCPMDYRFQEIVERLSRGPIEFRWGVKRATEVTEGGRLTLIRLR